MFLGLALIMSAGASWATPSTTFYTPCATYLQPFEVLHLTYDSYFNRAGDFPTDTGLTIGFLPGDKFQGEAGFDLFLPGREPLQFNFKLGVAEDARAKGSPGLSAGMFGLGLNADANSPTRNNFNVAHLELGKTIPKVGSVALGGYLGTTQDLFQSSEGKDRNAGWMVSYYRTLEPWTDQVAFTADYMSGENWLGGGGVGLYFWFGKSVDVILGWVWFEDLGINPYPDGIFTIQVDVDADLNRKPAPKDSSVGAQFIAPKLAALTWAR